MDLGDDLCYYSYYFLLLCLSISSYSYLYRSANYLSSLDLRSISSCSCDEPDVLLLTVGFECDIGGTTIGFYWRLGDDLVLDWSWLCCIGVGSIRHGSYCCG